MNDEIIPPEPRRSDRVANPFGSQSLQPSGGGALAKSDQQKAVAEVQARMMIARSYPRDPIKAADMILLDCTRPTLAKKALYQYARGGTDIVGPSIRLAEAIAQRWGNIASGVKEISRSGGYSECVAYAWDMESGYFDERQFQVRHWRDTKQGGYAVTDERDIYEMVANNGARRKRAALLTVIPGDVVEAAVQQCEETLAATADTSPDAMLRMVEAFAEFDVTREQIEKRIQRRLDAIRPAQVIQLSKIHASLVDGMSNPRDWFEAEGAAPGGVWGAVDAAHTAQQQPPQGGIGGAPANGGSAPVTRRSPRKAPAKEAAPEQSNPATNGDTTRQGAEQGGPDPQTNIGQTAPARTAGETPATDQGTPASAGEVTRPANAGAASGASASEDVAGPRASGAAFNVWLIDGDGVAIDGTDEFTDPVAFAKAYMVAHENMFPPELPSFRRANADALGRATELDPDGVDAVLNPPQPPAARAQPATTEAAPELPLGAEHDYSVVGKPTKPTRAAFVAYNETLKTKVMEATTEAQVAHIGRVNAETINSMPNTYRLAAVEILELRRKELAAPPPSAPPAQRQPATNLVTALLSDVYALAEPGSVTSWLQMPSTVKHLKDIQATDRPGWIKIMSAANSVYVRMCIEACDSLAACKEVEGDKVVDGALNWLYENDQQAYETLVNFSREHKEGLTQ